MTPQHIAFIMDGNRRWARAHKLEILMGHNRGAEQIEVIVDAAAHVKIPYVTFWAFSTENWKREEKEVSMLFTVFRNVLSGPMVKRLVNNGVKLQIMGDYKAFPKDIVVGLEKLVDDSKHNTNITATIALNYGGRGEILRAANALVQRALEQKGKQKSITEEDFASHLYTAGLPDPDMVIRTGGEERLSGFLTWQSVYSELYFTKTLWPDYDKKEFTKALEEFAKRERRFGK